MTSTFRTEEALYRAQVPGAYLLNYTASQNIKDTSCIAISTEYRSEKSGGLIIQLLTLLVITVHNV